MEKKLSKLMKKRRKLNRKKTLKKLYIKNTTPCGHFVFVAEKI